MPKGLKTSATLHLRPLVLALATLGSTPLATASPQQTPGEEYVNRNEGFRLLLPPGWRKVEETTKRTEGSVRTDISFEDGKGLLVTIVHVLPPGTLEGRCRFRQGPDVNGMWPSITMPGALSEEDILLSALPARKVISNSPGPSRVWTIILFGQRDWWSLVLSAGALNEEERERILASGSPGYEQFQQILSSFQFLEPVLGRLRTAAATAKERFYSNDRLGIKILLPPYWEVVEEKPQTSSKPLAVSLACPGGFGQVTLVREISGATPRGYIDAAIKGMFSHEREEYRVEVEEQITRSGMVGAKLTVRHKADNYWFRHWMLIFSSGKEHFRVVALTQEEFVDGYQPTFQRMLDSVEFLGRKP